MKNKTSLPSIWEVVRLGDYVKSEKGKKPKLENSTRTPTFNIPYIDIEAFEKGIFKSWTNGQECKFSNENDFLMVWDGSRSGLVGKGINGALGSTLVRINFPQIYNPYAYYFLKSKFIEINTRAKGSGTPHVDPDLLWNYDFPIPPYLEQIRIVTKIEELFSELDNGLENLRKAQELVKAYRQTLLKNAFEGKLTEKWRKENFKNLESAEELYQRLRNTPQPNIQKQKASFLPHHNTLFLPELPKTWYWTSLGCSGDWMGGGTPSKSNEAFWSDGHILWISPKDMKSRYITDTLQKISSKGVDNSSAKLIDRKSLLFVVRSGILRRILPIAIAPEYITVNQDLQSFCPKFHNIEFCYWYCVFKEQKIREQCSKDGTTVESIDSVALKKFPFPALCLEEQNEIINILENKLYALEKIEDSIKEKIFQVDQLRQSILKKAFAGELVTQDLSDESAHVFLKRIKSEKLDPCNHQIKSKKIQKVTI